MIYSFLQFCPLLVIRPYCNVIGCFFTLFCFIKGRTRICVVVLPSLCFVVILFLFFFFSNSMSGRLHRVDFDDTLVLPSLNRITLWFTEVIHQMSGRLHRVELYINTLVLPSMKPEPCFFGSCFCKNLTCRGDSQGSILLKLSFSPLHF